jgi:cell wall-associated NlpC family hydrolase
MSRIIVILLLSICLVGCKSSKDAKTKKASVSKVIIDKRTDDNTINSSEENNTKTGLNSNSELTNNEPNSTSSHSNIINYAKQFEGVRYKWGGTTDAGMDCSGLVFETFRAHDIYLPRISRDMAKQGEKISLKKTQTGDLLFFKTRNRRNEINHVGLVVEIDDNAIKFIHATTSAGVIISSLNESYWKDAFKEVRRIL